MLLMLKDLIVLEISMERKACIVYQEDLLPFALKGRVYSIDMNNCESKEDYASFMTAFMDIYSAVIYFISTRVLPLSRANADKIYNLLTSNRIQTPENKARISMMCHSVSLSDNYWVKYHNDSVTWSSICIRHNSLNDIFTMVALRGSSLSLEGNLCTPEVSTEGAYAKGWKREGSSLWLYKKGEKKAKIEVIVSNLLDHTNVSHVHYEDAEDDGEYCCKCPCMTTDQLSIIDADTIQCYKERQGINFFDYVTENFADDLYKMWIVDYLIANYDRHYHNWGFIYDADTTEILGLHPLFDHNGAFDKGTLKRPDVLYRGNENMTMREAALYAWKRTSFTYKRDFNRDDFLEEEHYEEFMRRLNELERS